MTYVAVLTVKSTQNGSDSQGLSVTFNIVSTLVKKKKTLLDTISVLYYFMDLMQLCSHNCRVAHITTRITCFQTFLLSPQPNLILCPSPFGIDRFAVQTEVRFKKKHFKVYLLNH